MIELEGEWNFEIPVTVQTAIVKELPIEKELAGITFFFDQLIMAPTGTILSYRYATDNINDELGSINFTSMSSYDRVYQLENVLVNYGDEYTNTVNFESMYLDKPDHLLVHVDNYIVNVNDQREFAIDKTMESQSFDFLGTTLTVDFGLNEEQETIVEITEKSDANRPYEILYYSIVDDNGNDVGIPVDYSYYLVDNSGEIYNQDQWEELEEPRAFTWTTQLLLDREADKNQPIFLQILDYSKTIFVEESIRLDFD